MVHLTKAGQGGRGGGVEGGSPFPDLLRIAVVSQMP